ncbi:AI-2E family transporter [Mesorhizobium liriopis]|uniref:AI-2E family transporter n=1 Tax=Mesorhizobium liriopis TaxID=2953882 RepID=UPI0020922C35
MKANPHPVEVAVADATAAAAFRRQLRFWLIAAAILVVFFLVFSDILLPFIAGMVLAYFLDPVADRLQRFGLSRLMASTVILLTFLVILIVGLMVLIPVLSAQFRDFGANIPSYLRQLQTLITSFDPQWLEERFGVNPADLRSGLDQILSSGTSIATTIFTRIWQSGLAIVNVAGLFIVTPVVAFYMLLDWDRMVASVDSWVPRDHVMTVRRLAAEINHAAAGFVRGQGALCLILGTMYAVGLTLVGLNFGILIGLFAGLISFIPYIGSAFGLVLALGVALVQFWPDWIWVLATACVFFLGQFIEGNILQPKLVGKSVGLHPVWLMFALFAFGAMFGFVGLLVAVPLAAAIGVLMRFALSRYLESPLYKGRGAVLVHQPGDKTLDL